MTRAFGPRGQRRVGPAIASLLAVASGSCRPPPVVVRERPFTDPGSVARAGSGGVATATGALLPAPPAELQGFGGAPDVSAEPLCPPSVRAELDRMRRGTVSLHGEPACTRDYDGEWAAVFATGTPEEASDVWVVVYANGRAEHHRVERTPYGVRYGAISIHRGLVALVGRSLPREEMPANADVLIAFGLPLPGQPAPRALDLQPSLLPLLGVNDRVELDARLRAIVSEPAPSSDAVRPVLGRAAQGPRDLIGALPSTQSIPVIREWQHGAYERLGDIHAQLDPTNARISAGFDVTHRLAERAECDEGWRCVASSARPGGAPTLQALFKRAGNSTVLAALLDVGARPDALAQPSPERLGAPRSNDPQDRALAERVSLEPIEGAVAGNSRGAVRLVAFTTGAGAGRRTHLYLSQGDRAPRRIEDRSIARASDGPRSIEIVDIDGNSEPEVLVVSRAGTAPVLGVSTLFWPPAVTDRETFPRLDAMRALLDASNLDEANRALRGFAPSPFEDPTQMCQVIERLTSATPRALAAFVPPQGLTLISYPEPNEPLRGTIRRVPVPEVRATASASTLLGPFATTPCSALQCDPALGFCKLVRDRRDVGYLWLGPRRAQPFWGVSLFSGR
jgi:hypothetical protein